MPKKWIPMFVALTIFANSDAATTADRQVEIPVTRAVIFSSGVGYFEHVGQVDGNAILSLPFEKSQINDVLKSLVFSDSSGGTITSVDYAFNEPVARALQSFVIDLSNDPTLPELLGQLRGVEVSLTAPDEVTGSILNVEGRNVVHGNPPVTTTEFLLTLTTKTGIRTYPINSLGTVKLTDEKLNRELDKALHLLSDIRDTNRKTIDINFAGNGKRQVRLGYLVEAPVWKTSYRLDLTPLDHEQKPLVQGWAIVENMSDNDWANVNLSLVSGQPISFIQDLYTPLYADRPVVKPEILASLKPRIYAEGFEQEEKPLSAPSKTPSENFMSEIAAPSPLEARHYSKVGDSIDIGSSFDAKVVGSTIGELFEFTFDSPVNIHRRRSAMIPLINQSIDAEKVSIYNKEVHPGHPLNGLVLKNTTGLKMLAGPITVFDGNTYAGDAQIGHFIPGDKRLVSYAVDLAVSVDPSVKSSSKVTSGKIVQGVLSFSRKKRWEQTYAIKNKSGQKREIILEHPFINSRDLIQPSQFEEKTASLYRFRLSVDAGATDKLAVIEEQTITDSIALLDANVSDLVYYQRGGEITQAVREALASIIEMKNVISHLEQRLQDSEHQLSRIKEGQNRLRDNLEAVGLSSQLGKRYLQKLSEEENDIERIEDERRQILEEKQTAEENLIKYLKELDVS